MRRFVFLALLALPAASFFSCAPKPSVTLVLLDPCAARGYSFRSSAAYAELAVFKNGCPEQQTLVDGDTSGAVFDTVSPADGDLPAVGDLKKGKYGFAVVMRDANCGVTGFGCTEADLNTIRQVRIQVQAWGSSDVCSPLKGVGCQAPATCVEGRCESDAGSGQCDLSLVASGNLPDVSVNAPQLTGPAVAATASGFVIGYRAQGTLDNTVQAVSALLSDDGHLTTPSTQSLTGCQSTLSQATGGVGLAFPFQGGDGFMLLSLQDCAGTGSGAGTFFVPVQPSGTLGTAVSRTGFPEVHLARVHSFAAAPTPGDYTAVFHVVTGGNLSQTRKASLQGTVPKPGTGTDVILPGDPHSDFAEVATTTQVQGLLVDDVDQNKVYLLVTPQGAGTDAGASDSGSPTPEAGTPEAGTPEAGIPEAGTPEAASPESSTSNTDASVSSGGYVMPFSSWGAITAWGNRVAAIVPGQNVPSTALTLEAATSSAPVGQATISGQFLGGDITAQGDHLIVVGSYANQLTLYRLDGAQAGPLSTTPAATVPFTGTIDKTSLTGFDGSHVAIAAGSNRVAVVWLSALQPGSGPIGGWALFSCQ